MPRLAKHRRPDDEGGAPSVDAHVGARIRLRRTLLGLSQTALADAVGLTFQQIQKYEKGANRVSASRLWQFGQVLDVPVSFFFDDLPFGFAARGSGAAASDPPPAGGDTGVMTKRETLELVRAYYRIPDPAVRQRLFAVVKAVSVGDPAPGAEQA